MSSGSVNAIRKVNKTIPIILGGPHLALYPEESIGISGVTYCLTGECDKTFTQLVDLIAMDKNDFNNVPGLYWIKDGKICSNPVDEYIHDLDKLPIPDRKLLEYKSYYSIISSGKPKSHLLTTMFSSRGCPYKCIFCDRPNMGKTFRCHSPQRVIEEIQHCIELGVKEILFYDDTFTIKKDRVKTICELMLTKKMNIKWDVRTRVNDVDYEMLRLMKEAGCKRIHFGVESGNEEILNTLKKGITLNLAKESFKNAHKVGIETVGYFMFGCPNETLGQMQETLDLALELNPNYAHFSILTPFPGLLFICKH